MSWPQGSQEIKWTTEASDGSVVCSADDCRRLIPAGEEVHVRDGRPGYTEDPTKFCACVTACE
jgi:hypothetical protein